MPLPPPAARQHYHSRRIECQGYAREDGLWDIEAHMTDTKTYGFDNRWRGEITPGTPIHEMWLRVTLDDHYAVVDVEAVTDQSPFEMCPAITPNFKNLIGLSIGAGWTRKLRERVGGSHGCTHLVELLGSIATVAFQTISTGRKHRDQAAGSHKPGSDFPGQKSERPAILGTCHAWAPDSPVVKEFMPEYYVEKKTGD